jgi:hypothetical protein
VRIAFAGPLPMRPSCVPVAPPLTS